MPDFSRNCLAFLLVLLLWGLPEWGSHANCQEKAAEKALKPDGKQDGKGKLPSLYSRLGLSSEQTKKVIEIQARYQNEIQQLQTRMTALKSDMKKEMLEALSQEQRARLDELQKMTKARGKD